MESMTTTNTENETMTTTETMTYTISDNTDNWEQSGHSLAAVGAAALAQCNPSDGYSYPLALEILDAAGDETLGYAYQEAADTTPQVWTKPGDTSQIELDWTPAWARR